MSRATQRSHGGNFIWIASFLITLHIPARAAALNNGTEMPRLRSECLSGSKLACYLVAYAYETGEAPATEPGIVVRDLQQATTFWKEACRLGEMWGCSNLGSHYLAGEGVERDPSKAAQLFAQSCDAGTANPAQFDCSRLGTLYLSGTGVEFDFSRGVSLLEKGCRLGNAGACELKKMHSGTGEVVTKSPPSGAIGFSFGWDKEATKKACVAKNGSWSKGTAKGSDYWVCGAHIDALGRDAKVLLTFLDGHLVALSAGYRVDNSGALSEHLRVSKILTDTYGLPSQRSYEVKGECGAKPLGQCINEKLAHVASYWEFSDHLNTINAGLVGNDDGAVSFLLFYASPAYTKSMKDSGL